MFAALIVSVILFFMINFLWSMTHSIVKSVKNEKKIKKWTKFQSDIHSWSDEIKDENVRRSYLEENISRILEVKSPEDIYKINIERERQKMATKWGKHIPSLLQENRNNKIEKII